MKRTFSSVVFISMMVFGIAAEVQAAPMNLMRSQANAVRAAVKKNLDIIIRPRLVVAEGATGPVSSMTLSADEQYLLTAAGDHSLRLWDLGTGREVMPLTGHRSEIISVSFNPDSSHAVSVDKSGEVRLWDLKNTDQSRVLPVSMKKVRKAVFASDGTSLVLGDSNGEVSVLNVATGSESSRFKAHEKGVNALVVGEKGRYVLTAGGDGKVRRFGFPSGIREVEYADAGDVIMTLALGPEKNVLVGGDEDGGIVIWNLDTGEKSKSFKAHGSGVAGLGVNAAASLLASGGENGEVKLWDLNTGREKKVLGRHEKAVTFVQVDRDGNYVLSSSEDGTTRLWNILSGKLQVTLISTTDGWAVVDGRGRFDGSRAALEGIEWREGSHQLPVNNFSEMYYEPVLLAKARNAPGSLAAVPSIPEDGIHLPPKVDIQKKSGARDTVVVSVRGEDQGNSGVEDVRLYQNGKLVLDERAEVDRTDGDQGAVEVVKEYDVDLAPGKNVLQAVAVNRERLESTPSVLVVDGSRAAGDVRLWLLTVGINKYKNTDLNLDYAEVDASAVKGFFTSERKFPFTDARVTHLADSRATKSGILDMMKRLQDVPAQDIAVMYMAGHGIGWEGEWYFIPHELDRPDPATVKRMGISSQELKRMLEAVSADRVFLIIDACHSGTAVSPMKKFQGMKALRMLARSVGVHILAATDKDQFAVELEELGHGVFTYSLLKGLDGGADESGNGQVSVQEIMAYVERLVPVLSRRYAEYPQYPTAHSRGFDFDVSSR